MKSNLIQFIIAFCFGSSFSGIGYEFSGWLGWWHGVTFALGLTLTIFYFKEASS